MVTVPCSSKCVYSASSFKPTHKYPEPPVLSLAPPSGAAKQTGGAFRAFILLFIFFFLIPSSSSSSVNGSAVTAPRRGRRPWPPPMLMLIPLLRSHNLLSPASKPRERSVRLDGYICLHLTSWNTLEACLPVRLLVAGHHAAVVELVELPAAVVLLDEGRALLLGHRRPTHSVLLFRTFWTWGCVALLSRLLWT